MKREPQYKHQCPTCKLPWKQIVLPGSSVEHAIDLTSSGYGVPRDRNFMFDDIDIVLEEGVMTMVYRGGSAGTAARRFGKTHV